MQPVGQEQEKEQVVVSQPFEEAELLEQEEVDASTGLEDPEEEGDIEGLEGGLEELTTIPGIAISSPLLGEQVGLPIEAIHEAVSNEGLPDEDESSEGELPAGGGSEGPLEESEERVTDLTITDPVVREESTFLSGIEGLAEADSEALRAVQSLAGARKVAEANDLIRGIEEEESESDESVETEVVAQEFEEKPEESVVEEETVSSIEPPEWQAIEETIWEPGDSDSVSLHQRLRILVSDLSEQIQASEVTVLDRDGFPLYGSIDDSVDSLRALNPVSIGEKSSSFQYTADGGQWVCQIFADHPSGHVLLRFQTDEPFEVADSKHWAKRLAHAIDPSEFLS